MKYNSICLLSLLALFFSCTSKAQDYTLSEQKFKNPSVENRPLAFWDWLNGYVDTTMLVYELEQMKEKGMQGAFIWDVGALMDPQNTIPAGPQFLDKESLGYISLAIRKGGELGLNLGLIASSSWNAGGSWIDDSDGVKQLLNSNHQITGPGKKIIQIKEPSSKRGIPEIYSLLHAIAIPFSSEPKVIDYASAKVIVLDEFITGDMVIDWEVPEGNWDVISFL